MLTCTSTISKSSDLMDCMRTNVSFPTTPGALSLNTKEFLTARGTTMKNFLIMKAPLSEPFFQKEIEKT